MKRKHKRKPAGQLRSLTKLIDAATPMAVAACRLIMLILELLN